jgi:hypothetical protein
MSGLLLRWRYYDPTTWDWDWYAQVDDVSLSCEIDAAIDIVPRSFPNSINVKTARSKIPVAILSSATFDATSVDLRSITFGPDGAMVDNNSSQVRDVNGDGLPDLMMNFRSGNTGIQCGDTSATLSGATSDGQHFVASDSVDTWRCP